MDTSGWNKVAAAVGEDIAELTATLPREFLEWLVSKTEEENWDKTTVYNGLCQVNKEGKTAISLLDLAMPMWTRLSMWAKKGLQLRVENKDLGEALKIWHKSTLDPDVGEEREEEGAELVRTLIGRRGVLVKLIRNHDDLRPAVQLWNVKNENLGEVSLVNIVIMT